jgi:hypothetical protein
MRVHRLDDMQGGWFVGDFEPSALRTGAAEVALKSYRAGDVEGVHWQGTATEVTLIVSGTAMLGDRRVDAGDIVVLGPGLDEAAGFQALTDVLLVAVKTPSLPDDKRVLG